MKNKGRNSALRIAFISEGFPPVDGGVAISTRRIARNLSKMGCGVIVLTFDHNRPLSEPPYVLEEAEERFKVYRFGPFFRRVVVTEQAAAVARRKIYDEMEKVVLQFLPDIVLSFYATTAGLLGGYLARRLKVPHVAGLRGNDVGRNIFSFYNLPILRSVMDASDWVVCVNEHLRERFALAFPHMLHRCSVIVNTVAIPVQRGARDERPYLQKNTPWPKSDIVAVFLGTPREKKGIAPLLHAIASVRARNIPLRLLVVGPGLRKDDQELCGAVWNSLIESGGLHYTGQVAHHVALQIMAEGDLIVMPSLEDGLANGLLEGMASGLCPVVSDLFSGTVVEGESGWVVECNNQPALAAALATAARSTDDRRRFGGAARKYVSESHEPAQEASAYVQLFRTLLSARP